MPNYYRPVIPELLFKVSPDFQHSGTFWRFSYEIDDSIPLDQAKIWVSKQAAGYQDVDSNGARKVHQGLFYQYFDEVTDRLPADYWTSGKMLMIERLYEDKAAANALIEEPDVKWTLRLSRTHRGDVFRLVIKLLDHVIQHAIPLDKIIIRSLVDPMDAWVELVALPTVNLRQRMALERVSAELAAVWSRYKF